MKKPMKSAGKSMTKASAKSDEKPRMTSGQIAKGDNRSKTMTANLKPPKEC